MQNRINNALQILQIDELRYLETVHLSNEPNKYRIKTTYGYFKLPDGTDSFTFHESVSYARAFIIQEAIKALQEAIKALQEVKAE
jgi:hypothetical protein